MIITDTLSNLFSKIKNGYLSKKSKITQQNSKQCINILNILVREGFIKSYKINSPPTFNFLACKSVKIPIEVDKI